ncbi:unnamed protein product [Orchesella dallaii]|uniref:Peptidase S1 domain-containing protein n=1 Tax=Orchesella dallaii TaxID=48710 RepID=A0ABP1PZW6_9HEXA
MKISNDKTADGIWDETENTRKLSPAHCACGTGTDQERQDKPWNLYVHSKTAPGTGLKTCTGTIIASNLIVTSHKCLTLEGKEMNIYDVWKPQGGSHNMVDKSDVYVTSKFDNNYPSGAKYTVKDIIFNVNYAYKSALRKKYLANDILIIVLEEDLFANQAHVSICVPPFTESLSSSIVDQKAVYYGAGKPGEASSLLEIRNDLVIRGGSNIEGCAEEADHENITAPKTFCVSYIGEAPRVEGGPLLVYSNTKPKLPFLVGIASQVHEPKKDSGIEFHALFSSVISAIKYLEYHANRHNSQWCGTPNLRLTKATEDDDVARPWKGLRFESVKRDESLNCATVCGQRNEDQGGRIVGGVEATPYEYGWMGVLILSTPGGKGSHLCGGSVINDRMILTAAHCVVDDQKARSKSRKTPFSELSIPPANIELTLFAHKRRGDTKAIKKSIGKVFYHPDYVEPRKHNFYDYDIALLILNEPLTFPGDGNGISPICLPKLEAPLAILGKTATVAGWGLTNPKDFNSAAKVLQKVEVPIAELSMCSDIARTQITDNFICAGTLNMWKDAAGGDSGGPLMIENDKGQWIEVGIVSWGEDVHFGPPKGTQTAALYTDVQS